MKDGVSRAADLLEKLRPILLEVEDDWEQGATIQTITMVILPDGYVNIKASSSIDECIRPLARALRLAVAKMQEQEELALKNLPDSLKGFFSRG